ncbi:hypothetical protein ACFWPK_34500 [Nocardia sp. NPDC058519]|uniref:hypothetical protein n=1 Tax=Nocardia sp. NPDC058519 TaxID=3346535 RepID=UPI00365C293C
MSDQTAEIDQLKALITGDDWHELTYMDDEGVDGFVFVEDEDGADRRWLRTVTVITKGPSGQHYAWDYEHGLTENQEDQQPGEYYSLRLVPVRQVEENVIVRKWVSDGE